MANIKEEELKKYIQISLNEFETDDSEPVVDYIFGIISDDSSSLDEKKESISEFLSSMTEKDSTHFCDELIKRYKEIMEDKQVEEQIKLTNLKLEQELKIKETTQSEIVEEEAYENPYYKLSREEQKKRDALLSKYGYDEEDVDSHGDILLSDHVEKKKIEDQKMEYGLGENLNAKRIADEEKAKREKSKFEHQKKVLRDKELLEKQRRDEEKKKTTKKEKRRL
ncbi:hypothetical protein DICPUDRAFT_149674 [Dictyostelium purpureum]|uniref:CCDC43 PWI-like domain-containing protein n=1 Tax=Dictyostelium purpureum TaxID=5786 RepID=F0ZED3_DICPU|nr:uncharacterized protein DICPUDRAFT_149674 [Dictyostelium purpureum]EGC37670.1 hypothetical protein DICPUDRAFT_149674 [Dictyostelium purpureum]|eukprot:XP_003285774.1 hypothetical protein DICPUDRAFT_149674 [Dictyostelium purpureum]